MSKISKKEIGRCFKLILKALDTTVDMITTGDFMSRFCANLREYSQPGDAVGPGLLGHKRRDEMESLM